MSDQQAVRGNFHDDLDSEAAKKVHQELRHLHLPTLNDIKYERWEGLSNGLQGRCRQTFPPSSVLLSTPEMSH